MKKRIRSGALILLALLLEPGHATMVRAVENSAAATTTDATAGADPSAPPPVVVSPDQALQKLIEGNKRYVQDQLAHPDQTPARRAEVAQGQHPFAVILGCSDSRVGPEIIFDQGLGDLFVVRVAGNVLNDQGIGSLEYAVEHLHVSLILVLGHGKCGAVTAAVAGGHAPGRIHTIMESLEPAVKAAQSGPGDTVDRVIKTNVERVVQQLKHMQPILEEQIKVGKLKIVGGRYDVETGATAIFSERSSTAASVRSE
jgi:carbonic anhydrase